jgi:hypothetical protein
MDRVTRLGPNFENMRLIDWGAICGYQGSCRAKPGHPPGEHRFSGYFPLLADPPPATCPLCRRPLSDVSDATPDA